MKKDTSEPNIRKLIDELEKLGFDQEQSTKILEWIDTLPIRNYGGEDIKVEIKKGVVRINEHLVEPNDLSFNKLPKDLKIYYLWDNGFFYNPFDLPNGLILYSPSGKALQYNKGGEPTPATDVNGEIISHNPFNGNVCLKFLYDDGKLIRRWIVNDNNEWEEKN